jgi:hypothetical protein
VTLPPISAHHDLAHPRAPGEKDEVERIVSTE